MMRRMRMRRHIDRALERREQPPRFIVELRFSRSDASSQHACLIRRHARFDKSGLMPQRIATAQHHAPCATMLP